ncbi:hypothetical protein Vadar_014180 [Vaccinium darrowii]|uniref:Uncharacterized protein n=1 Tax=Vaccinium darrowii TaxID=229202 RepID=A0ACB7YMW0_9ERIC|nr:hypothetical protein Vadar_014180 [Vaccinium darrowii]
MAIKNYHTVHKGVHVGGKTEMTMCRLKKKREMTMAEFKEWIRRFDEDKDGRISRDELREAIRATGAWFPSWKTKLGVKAADMNRDGFIEDNEITNLAEFAQNHLGIHS